MKPFEPIRCHLYNKVESTMWEELCNQTKINKRMHGQKLLDSVETISGRVELIIREKIMSQRNV